jgi:hypothetical protein
MWWWGRIKAALEWLGFYYDEDIPAESVKLSDYFKSEPEPEPDIPINEELSRKIQMMIDSQALIWVGQKIFWHVFLWAWNSIEFFIAWIQQT